MAIKILLVDDHPLIREGIATYLEDDDKYAVVGGAAHGIEALEKLSEKETDLVLSDISMPHMDGVELAKKIKDKYPDVKVIALTMYKDNMNIKKMISSGASGYVLKNCTQAELKKAIDTVESGDTYYSPEVTETIMNALKKKKTSFEYDVPLTDRELEVLKLVVKEHTNQEIADELFISLRTVDAHKRNLLEKTGSKNIAGLVVYAINNNLIEDI